MSARATTLCETDSRALPPRFGLWPFRVPPAMTGRKK